MKPIKFTQAGTEYSLNMDGTVTAAGQAFGTWSTDNGNRLELTPASGSTAARVVQPAAWRTDAKNRLFVQPTGGAEVDFLDAAGDAALLSIAPESNQLSLATGAGDFAFKLQGAWNLSADFENLELSFGTGPATVKFSGNVADQNSRFTWRFYTDDDTSFDLTFKGTWDLKKETDATKGAHVQATFKFTYATSAGPKNDQFDVPMVMSVSPNQNRLVLSYDKTATGGKATGAVEFVGRFDTKNGAIGSYTFEYRNEQGKPVVGGTLNLSSTIKKDGAATTNSLQVSFQFASGTVDFTLKGKYGSKGGSNWDFEFQLHHSAATPGESTLSLKLTKTATESGGKLIIEIQVAGGKTTISIDYNSASGSIQAGFKVELEGGKIKSASVLFGITF